MSEAKVLIFTDSTDTHAICVGHVLEQLGAQAFIVNSAEFPREEPISISYGDHEPVLRIGSFHGPASELRSCWNRRFSKMFSLRADLHPADATFVRSNFQNIQTGVLALLDEAFPVNPVATARIHANKLVQLSAARRAGLRVPRTLVSKDFEEISAFLKEEQQACFKSYNTHGWRTDEGAFQALTVRLSADHDFDRAAFEAAPHIYQEYIEKVAEYRVVIFGGYHSTARIDSAALEGQSQVDWRSTPNYRSTITDQDVPESVVTKLRHVMMQLNLRFGVFDVAETRDGDFVFFEVNEAGQWLWQEAHNPGSALLQPFSEFLLAADDNWTWDEGRRSHELSAEGVFKALEGDPRWQQLEEEESPDESVYVSDERTTVPLAAS